MNRPQTEQDNSKVPVPLCVLSEGVTEILSEASNKATIQPMYCKLGKSKTCDVLNTQKITYFSGIAVLRGRKLKLSD